MINKQIVYLIYTFEELFFALPQTLNEYIDLSKMFSTPKSSVFINGMLDRLIQELFIYHLSFIEELFR